MYTELGLHAPFGDGSREDREQSPLPCIDANVDDEDAMSRGNRCVKE